MPKPLTLDTSDPDGPAVHLGADDGHLYGTIYSWHGDTKVHLDLRTATGYRSGKPAQAEMPLADARRLHEALGLLLAHHDSVKEGA